MRVQAEASASTRTRRASWRRCASRVRAGAPRVPRAL